MNNPTFSRRSALIQMGALATLPLISCNSPKYSSPSHQDSSLDQKNPVRVDQEVWGQMPDGRPIYRYILQTHTGATAKLTNYGATLCELLVPDRKGKLGNVVLGFDQLAPYLGSHPVFGAVVGRFANRISNSQFTLDGKTYAVTPNSKPHHIHGGAEGFNRKLWQLTPSPSSMLSPASFTYESIDGEEGYPGRLVASVTYTLFQADRETILSLEYKATTDKPTVLNLTNHSYFNLAGSGDVLGHEVMIDADHYTPADSALIPTGEIATVAGTSLDFRQAHRIGERHLNTGLKPGGYDHNFILNHHQSIRKDSLKVGFAARVREPLSGRIMEVWTSEPGVQLYTSNHMNGEPIGTSGLQPPRYGGFCLETQHYPDSPNKPNFPSVVLRPGTPFHSVTQFRFKS